MCVLISLRCIRAKLEHHGNSLDSSFKTHFIDSHKFERIAKLLKRVSSRNASLFVFGGNRITCDRCRARPETDARSWTGDERGRGGRKTRSNNLSAESKWPIGHVTVLRTQHNTHTSVFISWWDFTVYVYSIAFKTYICFTWITPTDQTNILGFLLKIYIK